MRYVAVTGAYGGMGRATVNALREKGFYVFAIDKSVREPEGNVLPVEADITSPQSVASAFERIKEETEELFAVIHFAGIYDLDSLVEIDGSRFRRAFEINLFGAYNVNRTFLPLLRKGGRIIMTTSELAPLDPLPFTGLYAVTKSALDKYAYSLRMELQLLGIEVSVLRAGAVSTDMLGVSTAALDRFCENTWLYSCNADRFKRIVESVEARSVPPERIAEKMLKLLSAKHPRFSYAVNRNPLLLLLQALPKPLRFFIIRKILK